MFGRVMRCSALALLLALGAPEGRGTGVGSVWESVDAVFGSAGKDLPGGIHRYGWPRTDLHVRIGDVTLEPALALGSWGAFLPEGSGGNAMAMGDLVLLEKEVTPVITALEANGLEVTALHNHLLGETPQVAYVHFSGRGDAVALAKGLKAALAVTKTPLTPPKGAASRPVTPAEEATLKKLETALGRTGTRAGRVLSVGVPRAESITEGGMEIPATMGMSTSLNFQAVGDRVASTGDFVLVAGEVNPVIRELRAHGIAVTALHSHMLAESPRLFFLHFWAEGSPEKVGEGLKAALGKVRTK